MPGPAKRVPHSCDLPIEAVDQSRGVRGSSARGLCRSGDPAPARLGDGRSIGAGKLRAAFRGAGDLHTAEDAGGPGGGGRRAAPEFAEAFERDAGVVVVAEDVLEFGQGAGGAAGGLAGEGAETSVA